MVGMTPRARPRRCRARTRSSRTGHGGPGERVRRVGCGRSVGRVRGWAPRRQPPPQRGPAGASGGSVHRGGMAVHGARDARLFGAVGWEGARGAGRGGAREGRSRHGNTATRGRREATSRRQGPRRPGEGRGSEVAAVAATAGSAVAGSPAAGPAAAGSSPAWTAAAGTAATQAVAGGGRGGVARGGEGHRGRVCDGPRGGAAAARAVAAGGDGGREVAAAGATVFRTPPSPRPRPRTPGSRAAGPSTTRGRAGECSAGRGPTIMGEPSSENVMLSPGHLCEKAVAHGWHWVECFKAAQRPTHHWGVIFRKSTEYLCCHQVIYARRSLPGVLGYSVSVFQNGAQLWMDRRDRAGVLLVRGSEGRCTGEDASRSSRRPQPRRRAPSRAATETTAFCVFCCPARHTARVEKRPPATATPPWARH